MIKSEDYFTGPGRERRDVIYADELSNLIKHNADKLLCRINELVNLMVLDGVNLIEDPSTGSLSHSGWRPSAVNAATKGAAKLSRHMTGEADDLFDPYHHICNWCMNNLDKLEEIGLWMEHPDSTPTWCHLQSIPPKSGNRVFRP